MFIRQCTRTRNGKRQAYWALVESYRTERGPRQRVVAWLGKQDEAGREGTLAAAAATEPGTSPEVVPSHVQKFLFDEEDETSVPAPRWVEINTAGVRVENCRQFGGPWLALELIRKLKLDEFLKRAMAPGQEQVPWSLSSLILVIARLLEPSSELYTAEQWYPKTALPELLGVPVERVDDNRLYRTLDELLPQKEQLQVYLKERLGELFTLEYDLLLSTMSRAHTSKAQRTSLWHSAATHAWSGRRSRRYATGQRPVRGATCCGPMSSTGLMRNSGRRTCS